MRRSVPIFYNALLLTVVNLLLRILSSLFGVYISRTLGASGVGLLQLILSIGMLSMTAATAGIRTAAMYLTAEELGRKQPQNIPQVMHSCCRYSILTSCTVSLCLLFLSPILSDRLIGIPSADRAIRLLAIFLPFSCLSGCFSGYFTAINQIGTLAAVEVAEQFCYIAAATVGILHWSGSEPVRACEAVLFGSGVSTILSFLILLCKYQKTKPSSGKPFPLRRRLLRTALPLALADDLKSGISTTENLMVPHRLALCPEVADPLASFGMLSAMVFPILMLPASILFSLAELLLPEFARCSAAGSQKRISYLSRRSLRIALLYGCFFAGVLYLYSDKLCIFLYKCEEAGNLLRCFAPLIPILYCDVITDSITKGLGQQRICVRYNIITSTLDLLFLFLLLPRFGLKGYFTSFVLTHGLNFFLSLQLLIKITHLKIPLSVPVRILGATCLALMLSRTINCVIGSFLIFLLSFFSLLTLFQILSKEDLLWLRGLIQKN